jgi:hypothetical protein
MLPRIYFLKEDEQLVVESFTSRTVINGPGRYVSKPLERVTRRKALILGATDYIRLRNTLTGELENVRGPRLYFLKAHEEIAKTLTIFPLRENQYVRLMNTENGRVRIVRGETTVFLEPHEELLGSVETGVSLDEQHGVLVRDMTTGEQQVITGTQIFIPNANQEIMETRQSYTVDERSALLLREIATGELSLLRGPAVYIPPSTHVITELRKGVNIDERQAVLVRNTTTGQLTLIREKQIFIPDVHQEMVEVRKATDVDEQTAVLVRDITSGQLTLITEPQVFIPDEDQEVVEVRALIRLEDHQTVIIKDREGRYTFKRGSEAERSFFLQPYEELLTLWWSAGLHKDSRNLAITHIDNRPKYMWYEFEVRTQDNVELVIGITFFWQIVDVEAMIKMTDDATGDVSSHARSTIIQAVSRVTLERFLANFNSLVRDAVIGSADSFYEERGVQIHAVEVRSVACKDDETQNILMEIIQETTNRLNRLQKQESENEVKLKKLQGDIEAQTAHGQLLETQRAHSRIESLTTGEAEANRVRVFMEGLGEALSSDQKVAIFNTLRKQETLDALAKGNAHIYFTPNDVDLSIK